MSLDRQQLIEALDTQNFEPYRRLAEEITCREFGNVVNIRAILEYSNYCARQCKYCGLNCKNSKIERYRLSDKEIIDTAYLAHDAGYKTIVLQGGEDHQFTAKRLADIVSEIVKCGITITVSAGELDDDGFALLRVAGATRYLLKHEIVDSKIYESLHGDYSLEHRLNCLRTIKRLGYETGSGFMIGLPGQTLGTIADDILLLKHLECDMAGIGPFIPSQDTELRSCPAGDTELTKRAVALTRIIMPKILLPATTSLHVLEEYENSKVFDYGANVIMRKVTPTLARALYEIYPAAKRETDIVGERKELEAYIRSIGKTPK